MAITVVIADDEKWVLIGMKQMLEKQNLPIKIVGTAENGIEAMELLLRLHPDVLITDIRMPGMDGLELMEKMQNGGINSKVVFVTGFAEFEYVQKALRMGAVDYLLKPLSKEKIQTVMEGICSRYEKEKRDDCLEQVRQSFQIQTGSCGTEKRGKKIYQCIEIAIPKENVSVNGDWESGNAFSWLAWKKKKNRLAIFLEYDAEMQIEEILDQIRRKISPFLKAGGSTKAENQDGMGELLEEADTALCNCLFSGKRNYVEYKRKESERVQEEKYLNKAAACLEEKNWNRLRIVLEDLEQDLLKEELSLNQLVLIYNQIAVRLNGQGYMLEYFTPATVEERFGVEEKFFEYIRKMIFCPKNLAEDEKLSGSLLYSIVLRVKTENVKDAVTLGELAEQFNVSKGYLSSLLKKEFGIPYTEYITDKRIEQARELLADAKLSIEEVAEAVGYKDYFYFIKVFKKCTGSSPSKYRKTITEKILPN